MSTEQSTTVNSVHKVMSASLTIRAAAVIATDVVEEMRKIHGSHPIPTLAVGRTMVGALLMASQLKQNQEVGIYLRGNGPLESVFAEATFEGAVRGYTPNPQLDMALTGNILQTGPALGQGVLTVVQSTPYSQQPHRGTVQLVTGEVGDDLAFYYQQSLQIPSIVALGVKLDTFGRVIAAGGVLVEVMPGATDRELIVLEESARHAVSVSEVISAGAGTRGLLDNYLGAFQLIDLEHRQEVRYECRCSQERVERALVTLGVNELDEMIADEKPVEMICEFCGKRYTKDIAELQTLRTVALRRSLH